MGKLKDRTGEIRINNQGLKMKIVEYRGTKDINVRFEDGYVAKNREYMDFQKGKIKNPYFPSVYGVGFVGVGKYKSIKNGKDTKAYKTWQHMLGRCYSEETQRKQLTYKGCTVCKEWLNFQSFAKWFEDNIWDKHCTVLDKDILVKGNKEYSPNSCVLVDQRLNSLFLKCNKSRGGYPIGVHYDIRNKKFQANCASKNKSKNHKNYLGLFNTPQEAFEAYKNFKENYIKQIANEYKTKYHNFPNELYEAMFGYEVGIDD